MAGMSAAIAGEIRLRAWLAAVCGVIAALLLVYFGQRGYVETAAYSAFRAGTLSPVGATAVEVDHSSGEGYYAPGTSQEVRYRMHGGEERRSFLRGRNGTVDVTEGQSVQLGLWHGRLVSVDDRYVRTPWTPGVALIFPLLPAAFVLTVVHAYRLWRLRRDGSIEEQPATGCVWAAVLLGFVTGLAASLIDGVPWSGAPAFAVSALVPLTWFALRETRARRTPMRG